MNKRYAVVLVIVGVAFYFLVQKNHTQQVVAIEISGQDSVKTEKVKIKKVEQIIISSNASQNLNINSLNSDLAVDHQTKSELSIAPSKVTSRKYSESNEVGHQLSYTIDDGLAVIQGDIVIGEVRQGVLLKELSGLTKEPPLKLWPTNEIPYFVQSNLRNPERIVQALAYFSNTNIHFVPFKDQEDVIVFEQGFGACKSYLGHIGGRQPLWISEGCSATHIAHEIMHSLGFIHEQNRSDRDQFISIFWDNINPQFKINFEKFSSSLMKVSGLSEFDFESIMIYPETMFSINELPTMKANIHDQSIRPSRVLSYKDVARVNAAYAQ